MPTIIDLLKPSAAEIRELALRETDPKHVREFEQICVGPVWVVLLLLVVGLCAVIVSPFRIVSALLVRRHE
jgi:hypothetical protein